MLEIAGHKFRSFDNNRAASSGDYPRMDTLPDDYQWGRAEGCRIFSSLFFGGGELSEYGRELNDGVDKNEFHTALRVLMSSLAPKHEVKKATCGLLIDTYTHKI